MLPVALKPDVCCISIRAHMDSNTVHRTFYIYELYDVIL